MIIASYTMPNVGELLLAFHNEGVVVMLDMVSGSAKFLVGILVVSACTDTESIDSFSNFQKISLKPKSTSDADIESRDLSVSAAEPGDPAGDNESDQMVDEPVMIDGVFLYCAVDSAIPTDPTFKAAGCRLVDKNGILFPYVDRYDVRTAVEPADINQVMTAEQLSGIRIEAAAMASEWHWLVHIPAGTPQLKFVLAIDWIGGSFNNAHMMETPVTDETWAEVPDGREFRVFAVRSGDPIDKEFLISGPGTTSAFFMLASVLPVNRRGSTEPLRATFVISSPENNYGTCTYDAPPASAELIFAGCDGSAALQAGDVTLMSQIVLRLRNGTVGGNPPEAILEFNIREVQKVE